MDFLEKLRQKSESHRRRVAFLITAVFTGVVAFIWLFSLDSIFSEAVAEDRQNVDMPFVKISEVLQNGAKDFAAGVGQLKNLFRSEDVETEDIQNR